MAIRGHRRTEILGWICAFDSGYAIYDGIEQPPTPANIAHEMMLAGCARKQIVDRYDLKNHQFYGSLPDEEVYKAYADFYRNKIRRHGQKYGTEQEVTRKEYLSYPIRSGYYQRERKTKAYYPRSAAYQKFSQGMAWIEERAKLAREHDIDPGWDELVVPDHTRGGWETKTIYAPHVKYGRRLDTHEQLPEKFYLPGRDDDYPTAGIDDAFEVMP